ncbi:hypothetical protein NQ315_004948 [Exocentrus adspersus]|uniref:Uncharacterized protein n=1 Tax=Exocentrus adspersus TaxID=1586481 RepID=A0AAV8W2C6_9CUCU|nr:hypothetical protein NQ315_004948 [Exocentrus adspersus]
MDTVVLAFVTSALAQIYPSPLGINPYAAVVPQYAPALQNYIPIVRQAQDVREDGTYDYAYETANGIAAEEHGVPAGPNGGTAAQGGYTYTSPEGQVVSISYVADENGFRAVGDAIPTPPPIPPAIARSLAYIAAHPQVVDPYTQQGLYY